MVPGAAPALAKAGVGGVSLLNGHWHASFFRQTQIIANELVFAGNDAGPFSVVYKKQRSIRRRNVLRKLAAGNFESSWDNGVSQKWRLGRWEGPSRGSWVGPDKAISHQQDMLADWWFGTMEFYDFPFSWEFHPNWRTNIFFRGVGIPPTRYASIGDSSIWKINTDSFHLVKLLHIAMPSQLFGDFGNWGFCNQWDRYDGMTNKGTNMKKYSLLGSLLSDTRQGGRWDAPRGNFPLASGNQTWFAGKSSI